ncbi:hypothetical protein ABIC83_002955 [Roseateles asaccharophilus]|uniref:phage protein NinX family protein n=1 Tax=Roseateles asaccharophilus TaxID=582607 RepID=UPI003839C56F
MKVHASRLTRQGLNWAVAKALGSKLSTAHTLLREVAELAGQSESEISATLAKFENYHCVVTGACTPDVIPDYSSNIAMGMPLALRKRIHMCPVKVDGRDAWKCWVDGVIGTDARFYFVHEEPLVAAMRCLVFNTAGEEVDVPDDLIAQAVSA